MPRKIRAGDPVVRRKRTGEKRAANQPLKIDRLPSTVRESIKYLYCTDGKTWEEIEALSAEPFNGGKGPGFVDWKDLPTSVLELFPKMLLPHSTLHRWFDLRVAQVSRDVMMRAEQARVVAEAFARDNMAAGDEAVINAARNLIMGVVSEDGSERGRMNAFKGLVKLSEVMSKAKTNEIRERKVRVEEQALQAKLDEIKRKADALLKAVDGDPVTGAPQLSREQVLQQVKEIYGVA